MYNVMIVDDESVIKQGLLCFVDWEALDCRVVCDAQNGFDAMEKLASHPVDIVLTDIKMPGMGGLELSKFIHENYPAIKVIILTAFADFSYAQTAIKYSVVDFVIKTNPTEKIPEAIDKAKALITQEKETEEKLKLMEQKANMRLSEICEKFFKDVFNGIIEDNTTIQNKLAELEIKIENYFVVLFDINSVTNKSSLISPEDYNRFLQSVSNLLSMAFKSYPHYTVAVDRTLLVAIVSFKSQNVPMCTQTLLMTCNEILSMADSFMRFTISIGISQMQKNISGLSVAYQEAKDALKGGFYNDNHVSVFMPQAAPVPSSIGQPHYFAEKIVGSLQLESPSDAIANLETLMEEYRLNKEPIENIKVACMLIASYCFRLLAGHRLFAPDITESEPEIYKQIQASRNIQTLLRILTQLIECIAKVIVTNDNKYSYLIMETQKYIRDNFSKNINLQTIADHIHVNSSYLSRLYKKETGESIVDAINKYRIDHAKKLLKNPVNKVFEVACAVGIEDPAYFTHVFTKYTGMSPKEYKVNN
ncbi:MAG TPA: response regulator [Ruminiclostridium sp.]|nr:response regulator [Ruminiclostridium sp.]